MPNKLESFERELYISIDIEADGPIPGDFSMLSFGAVALDLYGMERGRFSANLELLEGASSDPDTMRWWAKFPDAWNAHRKDLRHPKDAMKDFAAFIARFQDKNWRPVAVCAPAGFDFTFIYWYTVHFLGACPFNFSCIDMRSFVMGAREKAYLETSKRYWPPRWFQPNAPHTHVAVDDAYEQGMAFVNALRELLRVKELSSGE